MILLDSNLVIYAVKNQYKNWTEKLASLDYAVSVVSKIETLGYHKISEFENAHLEIFLKNSEVLHLTSKIVDTSIRLLQSRKQDLDDALIAATALVNDMELWTHNVDDFKHIKGLRIVDPIKDNE